MIPRILSIALIIICTSAGAAELSPRPITTLGTATIQVVPDKMVWRLQVKTLHPEDPARSAAEHQKQVALVLDKLQGFGIDKELIQTSGMRLGEDWDTAHRQRKFLGYEATTGITFTLKDFSRYERIWIELSRVSGLAILGVNLDHSDRISFQDRARVDAVKAARRKAADMAEALEVKLGPPLEVEEIQSGSSGPWPAMKMMQNSVSEMAGGGGLEPSLAPGKIPVTVKVRCVFELKVESH